MSICPTHKFIDFQLDLRRLGADDWRLLGEAASKIAHVIGVPLQPDVAREMHQIALVKGVQATTAIEGNTLSEDQVALIAENKLTLPPSQAYLAQEVKNVLRACNEFVAALAYGEVAAPNLAWIRAQNTTILQGLDLNEGVEPGVWRRMVVGVGTYKAPEPRYVEPLMERFAHWLQELMDVESHLTASMHVLRAIVSHLYIAWIHPFGDGNGRTARLLEFALLLASGVPTPSAHILSNHYNKTRTAYYRELDRASKTGDIYNFIRYSLVGLVDGLREQIHVIQEQQVRVAFTDLVYKKVDPKTAAGKRRAHLLIDLAASKQKDGVTLKELAFLTPRLSRSYAAKTEKTLTRDLNVMRGTELLLHSQGRWQVNLNSVRAFLPFSANTSPWMAQPTPPRPS